MLNHRLFYYIDTYLENAATHVTRHMPINVETDDIYEGIIGEPRMREAFRNAVQYLPPASLERRVNVQYGSYALQLNLKLPPTDKYPVFLMPKCALEVNSQSAFGRALALPLKVAMQWEMLRHVWTRLSSNVDNVSALAITLSWLSPLLTGFDLSFIDHVRSLAERAEIMRQVAAIHRGQVPDMLPGLTSRINTVCRSGSALLSQFRIIDAAVRTDDITPRVQIANLPSLLPSWLHGELEEVIEEWTARQTDAKARKIRIKR